MANNFRQGYFTPKHPEKYVGDPSKIVYRSSWEHHCFVFLDGNPNILEWASEEIVIPYIKATDQQLHRYYPDLYVCYQNKNGEIKRELIEIKPKSQTKAPRKTSKNWRYDQLTYMVNVSKWQAAAKWCAEQTEKTGKTYEFKILTEQQLFA